MLGFIPMTHLVNIQKTSAELDAWGIEKAESTVTEFPCRISYNSSRQVIPIASGEEVVFTATILLEGKPDVDYPDYVSWTDDRGAVRKKQPIDIAYKHDLGGNPIAVKVVV